MSDRCLICTFVAAAHPEVGNGYVPHPFEPADAVHTDAYSGPDRRHLVRRMDDRISLIEAAMSRPEDRRIVERRSA